MNNFNLFLTFGYKRHFIFQLGNRVKEWEDDLLDFKLI